MKEILKEEIKRVHQLMYGSINEQAFVKSALKLDDVFSKQALQNTTYKNTLGKLEKATTKNEAEKLLNDLVSSLSKRETTLQTKLNTTTDPAQIKILNDKLSNVKKSLTATNAEKKAIAKSGMSALLYQKLSVLTGTKLVKFVLYLVASGAAIAGIAQIWKYIKSKNNVLGCVGDWMKDSRVVINHQEGFMTIKEHDLTYIKQKYPDGVKLIIAEKEADRKVYGVLGSNQTELGTWSSDNACNITIKIRGIGYKLFGSGQSQTPPAPTPAPRPRPGQGAYTNCTGTYNKGCKSPKIAQLQGCLGITPDGKWGPQTERAVRERTGRTQLIDQDIDQICGRTQPAPAPAPEQPTDFPLEFQ